MDNTENVLEKIHKAGLKFLIPLTPEENYALVVKEAMKLVKADSGSILIMQEGELKRVYASSPNLYKIKSRKKGQMRMVFRTRKPMIFSSKEIAKVNPDIKKIKAKSHMIIPLYYRHQSLGVLTLNSLKDNYFTLQDINVLKLFGPIASLAIRKTELHDTTKKALAARDLFISMAAHEFRTPLTTIKGYIQLLHSKLSGADTSESRWIQELMWESYRLTILVNELLEVERIKTGQFHYTFKECSLKEIIGRALKDFRFTHPERSIILEDNLHGSNDYVIGDYDKLLQVIINLLENAAKFSPSGSEITISLRLKLKLLVILIKDKGQGIPKKELPEVFERFYKGTSNPDHKGLGLGLFISKSIITQHRGSIKIHSKLNIGTSVEIRLPRTIHLNP